LAEIEATAGDQRSGLGHEGRFPPVKLYGRYRFRKRSMAVSVCRPGLLGQPLTRQRTRLSEAGSLCRKQGGRAVADHQSSISARCLRPGEQSLWGNFGSLLAL